MSDDIDPSAVRGALELNKPKKDYGWIIRAVIIIALGGISISWAVHVLNS
jgi:hypothetical protein